LRGKGAKKRGKKERKKERTKEKKKREEGNQKANAMQVEAEVAEVAKGATADERRPMIGDAQDLVCRVVFSGRVKWYTRDNWLGLQNQNAHALTLLVDHGRAKASRVNRRWHTHFREWLAQQMDVEARKAWASGVQIGLDMCNFVPLEEFEYIDGWREQYSVWLKNESLLGLEFICREGKGR
jgi:hypothetical protein